MLSRRDLVGRLAAGTAFAWAAVVARTSFASTPERAPSSPDALVPPERPASAPPDPATLMRGPDGPRVIDEGPQATLSAPPPWELLHPLAMGSVVAHGWHVAGLTGIVDGSSVLTLENARGRAHRVHLCRNDGRPQGLVYTEGCDLIAMNGGQGELPTEEGFAQAVAEVAHVVAANERHEGALSALLPHAERVRLFAGDADRRLR